MSTQTNNCKTALTFLMDFLSGHPVALASDALAKERREFFADTYVDPPVTQGATSVWERLDSAGSTRQRDVSKVAGTEKASEWYLT